MSIVSAARCGFFPVSRDAFVPVVGVVDTGAGLVYGALPRQRALATPCSISLPKRLDTTRWFALGEVPIGRLGVDTTSMIGEEMECGSEKE